MKHNYIFQLSILCKTLMTKNNLFSYVIKLIQGGKGEAIRIRAILRSLIPIRDLEGVISIRFQVPSVSKGEIIL